MGAWLWLVAAGLVIVLVGLSIHWSVVVAGALLPVVPIVAEILRRRRGSTAVDPSPSEPDQRRDVGE